jgi:hypothetical protein
MLISAAFVEGFEEDAFCKREEECRKYYGAPRKLPETFPKSADCSNSGRQVEWGKWDFAYKRFR